MNIDNVYEMYGINGMKIVNGDKFWYQNGELHREDGPAIEYTNGDKFWYQNDVLHRKDGPAIEYNNGDIEYWSNGIKEEY